MDDHEITRKELDIMNRGKEPC